MNKLIILCLLPCFAFTQNWNVFNKDYRYNYKYNNSALITNVLFADSIRVVGSDTIYHLNRIAVECKNKCYGFSVSSTPGNTLIVPNMPQFLQRKIQKLANGNVVLFDTTKILIQPKCVQNQVWLFDTTFTQSATCTAFGVQTIFGVQDSVKTILLNNADTVKLSKSFGLIVFPDPYGKNKYFRLVGIEKRHSYDQTALHGIKVPNAWDFYDFQIGDIFCHRFSKSDYWSNLNNPLLYANCSQFTIISKSVTPTGYNYKVALYYSINTYTTSGSGTPCLKSVNTQSNIVFKGLQRDSMIENQAYPGKLVSAVRNGAQTAIPVFSGLPFYQYYQSLLVAFANVASLVGNQNGTQFKVWGNPCTNHPLNPKGPYQALTSSGGYYKVSNGLEVSAVAFGTGLGFLGQELRAFEFNEETCTPCGPGFGSTIVSLNKSENPNDFSVFPNPVKDKLFVDPSPALSFRLMNLMGETVLMGGRIPKEGLDLSAVTNGVYFLSLESENKSWFEKIIVQH